MSQQLCCSDFHPSCVGLWVIKIPMLIKSSAKMYFLVNLFTSLFLNLKAYKKNPSQALLKFIIKVIKSTLFMTISAMNLRIFICLGKRIFQTPAFVPLFAVPFGALGCLVENTNRVMDYIMFSLPKSLESNFDLLHKCGYTINIPGKYKVLFAFSVSLAVFLLDSSMLKSNLKAIISQIIE